MLLQTLVETSAAVTETRARTRKIEHLTELLRRTAADETAIATHYLSGELPQGRIGLGPALLRAAAGGEPAGRPGLTLGEVDRRIGELATITGKGSQAARRDRLAALFGSATGAEQRFLLRLLLGELRQGALEGLMVEAIAAAAALPPDRVRRAVMLAGSPAPVAEAALGAGLAGLERFRLQPLTAVRPMLAQPGEDAESTLADLGEAALEYKLDGARVQLHRDGDEIRVYSRRLNDVTDRVPELVEQARALPAERLILDGETLALRADGRPLPFQVTMRRFGRRLGVEEMRRELPLHAFWFDCLHLDGEDLIDQPTNTRHAALAATVPAPRLIERRVCAEAGAARDFMAAALAAGHEGIMAKALDAPYEAGSRGAGWLKLKPAHSLDLVVLAAEWGSGRRRGWLSNLHLGARDPAGGGFVMLGKTFKGLTDALLQWQTEQLLAREISREDHIVHVRPELVVEIAFNDLQASPQYPGGLALRFARVKSYRADKTAAEADSMDTVLALYERQASGDRR